MKRLALLIIPALLAGTAWAQSSTPLVRSFTFQDSGHGFATGTFEFQGDTDFAGGDTVTVSGHTLTCNNMIADPRKASFGQTEGARDGYSFEFDGSNDSLSQVDAAWQVPAGDATWMVAVTPHQDGAGGAFVAKDDYGANDRSWILSQESVAGRAGWYISDDGTGGGGHQSVIVKDGCLTIGQLSIIVYSYDYISDGSSEMHMYCNELAVASNTSANGPIFDGTADFEIGARHSSNNIFHYGTIDSFKFIDGKALSATEAAQEIRMMRGLLSSDGLNHVTVTSASPPMALVAAADSGVEPFLVPQPANSTTIGPAGLYGASGTVNLVHRGVLETWAAGAPTGWTKTEGDGGSVDQDTSTMAEGLSSAKLTGTGGGGAYARITSGCITCTDLCGNDPCNCDAYLGYFALGTGNTEVARPYVQEYNTVGCGTVLAAQSGTTIDAPATWAPYSDKFASGNWHANTSSIEIYLQDYSRAANAWTWVDAITLSVSDPSVRDSYCGSDAAAATTCSKTLPAIATPWSGNFHGCIVADVTLPVAWDDLTETTFIVGTPGTAGNNNRFIMYAYETGAAGRFGCNFYDQAAGSHLASVAAAGTAGTTYAVRCCKTHDGRAWAEWNGTKGTEASGSIQDAIGATLGVVSYAGSVAWDAHVNNLRFERVVP